MTDIVLSSPAYVETPLEIMARTTLQSCFTKIVAKKRVQIFCHGNWAHSLEHLQWLVPESKKQGAALIVCLGEKDDMDVLSSVLTKETGVEVYLPESGDLPDLGRLEGFEKVSFFLPLSAPDSHSDVLARALKVFPAPVKVRIGVGWSNRLSGPSPIDEEDFGSWSDTLMALVEEITVQSERCENPIKIEFGCGLQLCLFDRLQLGELASRNVTWPIATCPKPFMVSPDGKLQPCVRLVLPDSEYCTDATDLLAVSKRVEEWLLPYSGLCYQSETFDCRSLRVKSCSTGCLQHSLGGWHR